ncbi:replication licensing factor Cdt1 [Branchiostoma belcheri]|nr:replication licensing factor Cdt1 [Branchiostoma belcheri]
MAQARVTEFYSSRKRSVVQQSSKRRKVQRLGNVSQESEALEKEVDVAPKTRTRARVALSFAPSEVEKGDPKMAAAVFAEETTPRTKPMQGTQSRRKTAQKSTTRKTRQTARKSLERSLEDTTIEKAFEFVDQKKDSSSVQSADCTEDAAKMSDKAADKTGPTAPCTPTKRGADKSTSSETLRKRKKMASTTTEATLFDCMKLVDQKKDSPSVQSADCKEDAAKVCDKAADKIATSAPCTPTKRGADKSTSSETLRKRKKMASTTTEATLFDCMKEGTPKKGFTFKLDESSGGEEQKCIKVPARRKLTMKRGKKKTNEADNTTSETTPDSAQKPEVVLSQGKAKKQNVVKTVKSDAQNKKSSETNKEESRLEDDSKGVTRTDTPPAQTTQQPSTPLAKPKRPMVTMTPSPCTPSPGGSRTPLSDRVREAIRQGSLTSSPKLTSPVKKEKMCDALADSPEVGRVMTSGAHQKWQEQICSSAFGSHPRGRGALNGGPVFWESTLKNPAHFSKRVGDLPSSQTAGKRSSGVSELQKRLARVKEEAAKVKAKEKTMTRAELREKLIKSGQLSSLQQHMKAVQQTAEKLQANKSKQVQASSSKETTEERLLGEMFRSMDTVVSILHNREELATFQKLKNAVQEMCRKKFETHHMGQIKTVFPSAYVFRQEKVSQFCRNQGEKKTQYQLTVQANLDGQNSTEARASGKPAPRARVSFSSSQLINRRNIFQTNLVNIVKEHHRRFIQTLAPSPSVSDTALTKWHPKFPLDTVPDIEPSPLPRPPDVQKYATAQDVLDQARGKILPRVQKALEKVAQLSPKETEKPKPNTTSADGSTSGNKGAKLSLLERIRAKEAAKAEKYMTRDADQDRRTAMIGRLPDLARILRTFFVTEKKPAVPIESAVKKMSESYRSVLSSSESEAHLKLLTELAPDWLSVVKISKGTFLKMDRNQDINIIVDKLNKALKDSM